jgi:chromosomal replication initiator protein
MCRRWFDNIEALGLSGGTLRLLVREPVQLKYLQRHCQQEFTEAAQAVIGMLVAVRFVGDPGTDSRRNGAHAADDPQRAGGSQAIGHHPSCTDDEMVMIPDNSFENFVVGPGNRLAHAGAVAVAKKPAADYNPFFVHGGVGLGKTHLLQAICQAALHEHPDYTIHYTSCHDFVNRFHEAIQAGDMNVFRDRYRNVDLLVIDDIHDLANREQTQEEFFHTFNALTGHGKQIVLSSDAAPNEIPALEERLSSRFNCGLVAGISKPSLETRITIIKSKAALRQITLPDDVASFVAARIDSNIRELEGAITRLQGLAAVTGAAMDLELARQALGSDDEGGSTTRPSIQEIVELVTSYYGIKLSELLSKRRHRSIVLPRQVCMWLARRHTRYSLAEIGGYFGGRDHTTVMHAIDAVSRKCRNDTTIAHDVRTVEERLLSPASA